MNITVEIQDKAGVISTENYKLTRLAFAKHLALAGQKSFLTPQKLIQAFANLIRYSSYIQRHSFENDKFSEPPFYLSDPTEKSQFSNLAGKAIADFLSKRIGKSLYTQNYEGAMKEAGVLLKGQRPDLIAFTQTEQFAIEAKGLSVPNVSNAEMTKHKKQSKQGGIPVDYTVACVSYNLYKEVKCNYYDPENDNKPTNHKLLQSLSKKYYSGFAKFLNEKYFYFDTIEFQNEKFYKIQLSPRFFKEYFIDDYHYFKNCCHPHCFYECIEHLRPSLLLPEKIKDFAHNGLTSETKPFIFDTYQEYKSTYIDNDRIGLQVKF